MAETKSYQVSWTHTAQQDLTEIIEYIAQDNIADALAILQKPEIKAGLLITLPNRGTRRARVVAYRHLAVPGTDQRALAHRLPC